MSMTADRRAGQKRKAYGAVAAALSALALVAAPLARASPCPAYDIDGNGFLFGTPAGDFSLGAIPGNATIPPLSLTDKPGRPAFDGSNTQCFTGQFTNGLYVINADANSTDAYIYDFADGSWSRQATSGSPGTDGIAILDHDTNVLFSYSTNSSLSSLSFPQEGAKASSETIAWQSGASANSAPEALSSATTYEPVLGAANNHIQFLGVPGAQPGQAYIFVIHFAYWQPEIQSFAVDGNAAFPTTYGQTVTIQSTSGAAPPKFAYIPDDASGTYIVDAKTNTTVMYPPPPSVDPLSRYAASQTTLLQYSPNGTAAYFNVEASTDGSVPISTSWETIDLSSVITSSNSTAASGATTLATGAVATGTAAVGAGSAGRNTAPAAAASSASPVVQSGAALVSTILTLVAFRTLL